MPSLPLHQKWHSAALHVRIANRLASSTTLHQQSGISQNAGGYLKKLRDGVKKAMALQALSLQAEAREMITQEAAESAVQTEVDSEKALKALAKWQQGDLSTYTEMNIERRMMLRVHPRVTNALHRWWEVALLCTNEAPREAPRAGGDDSTAAETVVEATLSFAGYSAVLLRLYRVMMVDFDEATAARDVENDWRDDLKGAVAMTRTAFGNALFMLADLWTDGMAATEYERFLNFLFERITCVDAHGRLVWRPEADCIFDSRFKQSEEEAGEGNDPAGGVHEVAANGDDHQKRQRSHGLSRRGRAAADGRARRSAEPSAMRASKKLQAAVRAKKARKTSGLRKKAAAIIAASSRVRAARQERVESNLPSETEASGGKRALGIATSMAKWRARGQQAKVDPAPASLPMALPRQFNDALVRFDTTSQAVVTPQRRACSLLQALAAVQASTHRVACTPSSGSAPALVPVVEGVKCFYLPQNGQQPVATLRPETLGEMEENSFRASRTGPGSRTPSRQMQRSASVPPVRSTTWQRPATRLLLDRLHQTRYDEDIWQTITHHAHARGPSASAESSRPPRGALSQGGRLEPLSPLNIKHNWSPELRPLRTKQQPRSSSTSTAGGQLAGDPSARNTPMSDPFFSPKYRRPVFDAMQSAREPTPSTASVCNI